MKYFRPLFIATALFAVQNTYAQQNTSSERAPLITDVYFPIGFYAGGVTPMTTTDWRNLMPNSELLKRDLSWDQGRDGMSRSSEGAAALEVAIGLDLGRNKGADARFDKQLRLGVSYLDFSFKNRVWSRSYTGPYDTLTSSLNNQVFLVDTTWNDVYRAEYAYSRIGLNASYILRKRTPNKWSWYVGFGGMVGTTLNARATVRHNTYTNASSTDLDYPDLNDQDGDTEQEEMRIASTPWGAAYALAGIDLRIGKTHPFWSSVHLFNELRPSMMFGTVPGSKLSATPAMQNLFGLRLDLR